jgi:hypothetical protein
MSTIPNRYLKPTNVNCSCPVARVWPLADPLACIRASALNGFPKLEPQVTVFNWGGWFAVEPDEHNSICYKRGKQGVQSALFDHEVVRYWRIYWLFNRCQAMHGRCKWALGYCRRRLRLSLSWHRVVWGKLEYRAGVMGYKMRVHLCGFANVTAILEPHHQPPLWVSSRHPTLVMEPTQLSLV